MDLQSLGMTNLQVAAPAPAQREGATENMLRALGRLRTELDELHGVDDPVERFLGLVLADDFFRHVRENWPYYRRSTAIDPDGEIRCLAAAREVEELRHRLSSGLLQERGDSRTYATVLTAQLMLSLPSADGASGAHRVSRWGKLTLRLLEDPDFHLLDGLDEEWRKTLRKLAKEACAALSDARQELAEELVPLQTQIRQGALRGEDLAVKIRELLASKTESAASLVADALLGVSSEEGDFITDEISRFEATGVRHVLELSERLPIGEDELFWDLGSGNGRTAMLMHLLTGVRCRGTEYQEELYEQASRAANDLNLEAVEFQQGDVAEEDLSEGTIFFIFNAFAGTMMDRVLTQLQDLARNKGITICSLSSSSDRLRQEPWLEQVDFGDGHSSIAIFIPR